MKQSTTALFASATDDELCVAQILLDLPNTIFQSESQFSELTWSCKRRRSTLRPGAPCSRLPSSQSPSMIQKVEDGIEESNRGAAITTASPDTPLSFPSSESDEKTKHSSKQRSNKRSREKLIDRVEELTKSGDVLRGEIENVRKYLYKLKTLNSKLKAKKDKVLKTLEETQKEIGQSGMNLGAELTQRFKITVPHQQPLIEEDLTSHKYMCSFSPIAARFPPTNNGLLGLVNQVGPAGIPDLNVSLQEEAFTVGQSQPLDMQRALADRRARFAEARRMRRGLIKIKSMRSACGIKLPSS